MTNAVNEKWWRAKAIIPHPLPFNGQRFSHMPKLMWRSQARFASIIIMMTLGSVPIANAMRVRMRVLRYCIRARTDESTFSPAHHHHLATNPVDNSDIKWATTRTTATATQLNVLTLYQLLNTNNHRCTPTACWYTLHISPNSPLPYLPLLSWQPR